MDEMSKLDEAEVDTESLDENTHQTVDEPQTVAQGALTTDVASVGQGSAQLMDAAGMQGAQELQQAAQLVQSADAAQRSLQQQSGLPTDAIARELSKVTGPEVGKVAQTLQSANNLANTVGTPASAPSVASPGVLGGATAPGSIAGNGFPVTRDPLGSAMGSSPAASQGMPGSMAANASPGAVAKKMLEFTGSDATMTPTSVYFEAKGIKDDWKINRAVVHEELNTPYQARLTLRCPGGAKPQSLLGKSARILVERGQLEHTFHGVIHTVKEGDTHPEWTEAVVHLAPALFMLTKTRQSRVHRAQSAGAKVTVKDILTSVLGKALKPYQREVEFKLDRKTYPSYEHRIQYDESDFDFASRLMEEEGLFYWFDQSGDAEKMVVADHQLKFENLDLGRLGGEDGKTVSYVEQEGTQGLEGIRSFARHGHVMPSTLHAVHFEASDPRCHPGETDPVDDNEHGAHLGHERQVFEHNLCPAQFDSYDWGKRGGSDVSKQLKEQIRIRREEQSRDALVGEGESNVVKFSPGLVFSLKGHRGQYGVDGEYLLTSVIHDIVPGGYDNEFSVVPAATPWRPERTTEKPRIYGLESATVVTSGDEEIETDLLGRIKVQFHWDREGKHNEHSSCFIRVMQPWAGADWGFHFLPRVGMEVAVSFIQGDPDRPVVSGTLYNGANKPPYGVKESKDASKTRSTIRTRSSKGSMGYNELSFEDEKDKEEVYLQAQKNLRELVKNNHTSNILAYRSETIGAGAEQFVTGGASRTIDGGLREVIKKGETKLKEHKTETPTAIQRDVDGDVVEHIVGNETRTVTKDRTETVTEGGWHTQVKTKNMTLAVDQAGQDLRLEQGDKKHSIQLKDRIDVKTSTDFKVTNGPVALSTSQAGDQPGTPADVTLSAANSITLNCGQASITLYQDGVIEILGAKEVRMGSAGTVIKATPAKLETNSPTMTTSATGLHEITGGLVKIN